MQSASRSRMSSVAFAAFLLAALAPDITDALFFVTGICSPYGLYSHTLHAVILEAAIVAGAALLATGSRSTAMMFAIVVLLHLPADLLTGHKLFMPGGELIGLHLYERPLIDFLMEAPLMICGWWLLRRSGRGPTWATSGRAILLLLVLQTTFDVLGAVRKTGVKPSACFRGTAVAYQTALVTAG
jgi:hypothetical protein